MAGLRKMTRKQDVAYLRMALFAFVIASLLIFLLRIESVYRSSMIYGLTLTFLTLSLVPFFLPLEDRCFDILEPVYVVSSLYLIAYGFPVILETYLAQYALLRENQYITAALIVALTGLLFFFVGYFNSGIPKAVIRRLPRVFLAWNASRVKFAILALCGVGWLARLYTIYYYGLFFIDVIGLHTEVSLFSGVVLQLSALTRLGLVLLSVFALSSDPDRRVGRFWKGLLILMLSVELLYSALQGAKGGIIITLLILIVPYHYLRVRLGVKLLVPTFVVILLIFPVMSKYRELALISGNPLEATPASLMESLSIFRDAIGNTFSSSNEALLDFLSSSLQITGHRVSHLNILSTVISRMPEAVEYQYGKTFLVVVNAFIPRFLWADRPQGMLSNEFARQFGFDPLDLVSVTNFSMIEELYINFHVIGVAAGMFIFGLFLRIAYQYLILTGQLSPVKVLIYALVLQILIGLFDLPLSSTLMTLPREMVLLFFVVLYIAEKMQPFGRSLNVQP